MEKPQSITDKIQSLQTQIGAVYKRPDVKLLDTFKADLEASEEAKKYLADRGLEQATIDHFQLGYDKTKDAISIPIFKRGELINIKYRFLNPDGVKYIQEYGAEVWLYNEDGIQKGMEKKGVLVVEGEFDLMSVWQAGIENVVSPASGKESYGVWIELLDSINKIFIAYDNDKPGKEGASGMAERLGETKCKEVLYPEGIKDANDYFKKFTGDDFKKLIKDARPFYTHKFKGVVDIIHDLRFKKGETLKTKFIPEVKMGEDWLVIVSGVTNVGKTSYVMNIANDFVAQDIPVLVLPFERGNEVVGKRFLQVKYNMEESDFFHLEEKNWKKITEECLNLPLYFTLPTAKDAVETIIKAKRIFNTKVVIIDHLDYMIRSSQNKEAEIGNTLQMLKRVAEENKILMIIVTHIRKIQSAGSNKVKKPNIEDLKGSASLFQDPECVVMLSNPVQGEMFVDVLKNKGKMEKKSYTFFERSGTLTDDPKDVPVDPALWGNF